MKYLKNDTLYRHPNSSDIDLFILHKCDTGVDSQDYRVLYYNRHYEKFLDGTEVVTIKHEDSDKWEEVI